MKLELKTLDYFIKKDEVEKYLKYGFTFIDDLQNDRESYRIDSEQINIIDINTMEELKELENTFRCGLIYMGEVLYIYNDYFE